MSYGKIMIFGFSALNYAYLVTFGRKIKFSIFCQFQSLGLSHAKGKVDLLICPQTKIFRLKLRFFGLVQGARDVVQAKI